MTSEDHEIDQIAKGPDSPRCVDGRALLRSPLRRGRRRIRPRILARTPRVLRRSCGRRRGTRRRRGRDTRTGWRRCRPGRLRRGRGVAREGARSRSARFSCDRRSIPNPSRQSPGELTSVSFGHGPGRGHVGNRWVRPVVGPLTGRPRSDPTRPPMEARVVASLRAGLGPPSAGTSTWPECRGRVLQAIPPAGLGQCVAPRRSGHRNRRAGSSA